MSTNFNSFVPFWWEGEREREKYHSKVNRILRHAGRCSKPSLTNSQSSFPTIVTASGCSRDQGAVWYKTKITRKASGATKYKTAASGQFVQRSLWLRKQCCICLISRSRSEKDAWSRGKLSVESWKAGDRGLSSRKSLAFFFFFKKRERGNVNQILFPIIFQIGTEKENTHIRAWHGVTQVCCWKESPCLYWSKVLKISKEQIHWFWGSLGVKKRKNKEVLFARSVQMTSQEASLMVGEGRGQVPTPAHGQNCPKARANGIGWVCCKPLFSNSQLSMCEKTDRYWLVQMPLSWQHLRWKYTRLAQTFCKFSFRNLIMTLDRETIHTWRRPLCPAHPPTPSGTCNWRELSGFIKLVIQISTRKRQLQANLGVIRERDALLLVHPECQKSSERSPRLLPTWNSDYPQLKHTSLKKLKHKAALFKFLQNTYGDNSWFHDLGVWWVRELHPFCCIHYPIAINCLFLFLHLPNKMLKLQFTVVKSPGNSRFVVLHPALIKHACAFYNFLLIDASIEV